MIPGNQIYVLTEALNSYRDGLTMLELAKRLGRSTNALEQWVDYTETRLGEIIPLAIADSKVILGPDCPEKTELLKKYGFIGMVAPIPGRLMGDMPGALPEDELLEGWERCKHCGAKYLEAAHDAHLEVCPNL